MYLKKTNYSHNNEEIDDLNGTDANEDIVLEKDNIWYENAEILLQANNHSSTGVQQPDFHGYNLDSLKYTNAFVVLSVRDTDVIHQYYVITKARYKFGN